MEINDLLKGVDCGCGKHHSCDIRYVYIEKDALRHLEEICGDRQRVLVVADENTFRAAGEKTLAALPGKQVEQVIFSGKEILVPNEDAIRCVTEKLGPAELIVGIGSGVIQDLCKYVSHEQGVPYLIVATAPSMDGYASTGAAMILGGMKVTCSAGLPEAILGDVDVLKNAPMDMIQAGYGDIIGKFSALNDWRLSALINGEYYCGYIYDATYAQIRATLDLAGGILERREDSIQALMEALVIIGIMMSFAGSSRPASGSEHHFSHFFEITGLVHGEAYLPHGIDVAYSTVVTSQLREKLLARSFPGKLGRPDPARRQADIQRIYGPAAEGCVALQQKVGNYAMDRAPLYAEKEKEIKAILAQCPTAGEIREMLALVNLDMGEFYRLYSPEKLRDAVLYAKDLKDRYTVLWLHYDLFGAEAPA